MPCIGAINTYGALAPVTAGTDGNSLITPTDFLLHNIATRMGYKSNLVVGYDAALGNTTVRLTFGTFLVFYADSGAAGGLSDSIGNPPVHPYLGRGAGNCVMRSQGRFTVDNGLGTISFRSDIDGLDYEITIDYVTGEISVTGTPPPDGTTIMIPTS